MAPFAGAMCFLRNDQYDIASDDNFHQDVKPVRRKSKWNFIKCIRRKRKSRNKKLIEESNDHSPAVVKNEIVKTEVEENDIEQNLISNSSCTADDTCVNDTSRLLCVGNKFPSEDLSDSVPKEEVHKCVACGETKLCQQDLLEHLMKHVYEGLNAAMWLSTAMSSMANYPIEQTTTQNMPINPIPYGNL